MKLLITGASGFIATALVPRLQQAGYNLVVAGRDAEALRQQYPGMEVTSYENFQNAAAACNAIIHTAVLNNDSNASDAAFHAVNVELPVTLATQAIQAGVPLFVNFTTLLAIEPPFRSAYARTKWEGEQALNALEGINIAHIRLPAVYTGQFRGKLAILNKLPRFLRSAAFTSLAALRPTLHIDRLMQALHTILAGPVAAENLVTDTQSHNKVYQRCNRLMDIGFALFVFTVFLPLLVWACVVIRRDSRGPILFRQPRVGRYGKIFTCYKFRTMAVGTQIAGTHEVSASTVTKAGQSLRRTRIDELPQAWNVLLGQMSLIGPRPCLPVQQELVEWRQRLGVLEIKPGITGLAQVRGVDMSGPERLAQLDAEYVARQSLLLDLKILIATARGSGSKDYVQSATPVG